MKRIIIILAMMMSIAGCNKVNPFLFEWKSNYGLPPFDQIRENQYMLAVKMGIRQQASDVDAIIASGEEPTFDNTIAAYDRSGATLDRVTGVLFNLSETDGTPSLQRIVEKVLPLLSEHNDNIFMNPYFFERVKYLYDRKKELGLTREQEMVLEKIYRRFEDNGNRLNTGSGTICLPRTTPLPPGSVSRCPNMSPRCHPAVTGPAGRKCLGHILPEAATATGMIPGSSYSTLCVCV